MEYVVQRLQKTLSEPYVVQGSEVSCTASIGIITSRDAPEAPAEVLIKLADQAMYTAKKAGGDHYHFYGKAAQSAYDRMEYRNTS